MAIKNKFESLRGAEVLPNLENFVGQDLKLTAGRVRDIILDENHPEFFTMGQWAGVGTIFFENVDEIQPKSDTSHALPLLPNQQYYPLVNEIVLLFYLPNKNQGENDSSKSYFYLNPISIWNHPHLNAYPNIFKYHKSKDAEGKAPPINLNARNNSGGKFEEKNDIHPLSYFSGDNIYEGRWGNSIRLGSTISTNSMMQNNWSNKTPKGDPIMILRNGNRSTGQPAFTPITEKIQEDPSSIYLTSTQKIPFEPSSKNYTALEKAPIEPGSYKDSQIILNSGRLILNSKVDSILLSSQKSINLASVEDIGIASDKDVTIEADNIFLGGKLSNQPAINGEYFMTQFGFITFGLKMLIDALNNDPKVSPVTKTAASLLVDPIEKFHELVKNGDFLSKKVKI